MNYGKVTGAIVAYLLVKGKWDGETLDISS